MENEIGENKFKVSIMSAIGILILYTIIIAGIIDIPFFFIGQIDYLKKYQIVEGIVNAFGEGISNMIIILLILRKVRKNSDGEFHVKYVGTFNWKILFAVVFLIIGYDFWYQNSIGMIIEKMPVPEFIEEAFENLYINPYSAVISITIIAPIFEEIVMRGIILEGFLNKYKPQNAIIFSALVFGIWHFNIPQFMNATLIGLILGVLYYKTNSLVLCIVAHMTNNVIAIMIEYPNDLSYGTLFFAGIVIFTISGMLIMKYIKELRYVVKDDVFKNLSYSHSE